MSQQSDGAKTWAGDAGRQYTDRNPRTVEGMNELRDDAYGHTQFELDERFLGELDRDLRILEVGSNVGVQLRILREMGFENVYGLDVNRYALARSRTEAPDIEVVQASALDIPFPTDAFDLVFTIGVLVTIPPEKVDRAVDEIVRCSRRYVWGLEFFAEEHTAIRDRGLYWKGDFPGRFRERHDLRTVRAERLPYLDDDNEDVMYLFEQKR